MKKIYFALLSLGVVIVLTSSVNDPTGKWGYTGSPSESTCNKSGCHSSYTLNSGAGSINITSNIPNWEYTPGQVYTVNVTLAYSGKNLFGFDVECLDSTNQNFGTFTAGTGSHSGSKTISGVTRTGLSHTVNGGATANSHTFTFTWTAPAAGTGNATFYFAGICADNNGNQVGDYVYSGSQVITEHVAPSAVNNVVSENSGLNIFPVPAQNEINLSYSLQKNGFTSANIYFLNGESVQQLFSENQHEGNHTFKADISNLSKGIYLLELNTGTKKEVRKISVQ